MKIQKTYAKDVHLCQICGKIISDDKEICSECQTKMNIVNENLEKYNYRRRLTPHSVLYLKEKYNVDDVWEAISSRNFYVDLMGYHESKQNIDNKPKHVSVPQKKSKQRFASANERKFAEFLDEFGVEYKTQHDTVKCVNPLTNCVLPFDFEIDNLPLLVEINGKQHYEKVDHYHGGQAGFNYQLFKDSVKEQFAKDNGYILLKLTDKDFVGTSYKTKAAYAVLAALSKTINA